MTTVVIIYGDKGGFAENKDLAKELRVEKLLPALDLGEKITIDFSKVTRATQSFVHALIGEALQKHGEDVLDLIEFRSCSPAIQGVIQLVVDYSVGGFNDPTAKPAENEKAPKRPVAAS